MAPDKIYVHEASAPELAEPVLKEYHIEYIRKDSLLEWAKEQEKKLESDSFTSYGKRKMLERIIDKIESL